MPTPSKSDKLNELTKLQAEARAIRLKIATLHHELHAQPMPKPPASKIVPEWWQQPRVTDHALIRYIERKLGVSLDPVRKEILSHQVIEAMKTEDEQFVLVGNHWLVIKSRHVVTCLEYGMRDVERGSEGF